MTEEPHRLQDKSAEPAERKLVEPAIEQSPAAGLGSYKDGELVIGLIGAVGTELLAVVDFLAEWLTNADYEVKK